MEQIFAMTRTGRTILAKFLDDYTAEELNYVPPGFNNNLIWNIAHIVVVQQMLVYNLSGLPMLVPRGLVDSYKRGTKPERPLTPTEIEDIRSLLVSTIDQTEKDFAAGKFKQYTAFTTMTGFHLESAKQAMAFNFYHEGVHTGVMMGLRKFVRAK